MALKGCYPFIIGLFLILSPGNYGGLRACPARNSVDPSYLWEVHIPPSSPDLMELYGEVTAISATEITIDTGSRLYQLSLSPHAQIFCNGLPAVWFALRPVAPEAFFEAKVRVNHENKVVSITGVYWGEICVLQSWRMEDDNLYLKLTAAGNGRTFWRMVAPRAKIPKKKWLAEEIEIYVLYNYQQNIRAVFFPE